MKTNHPWERLSEAARQRPATVGEPAEIPLGFSTRVLARLCSDNVSVGDLLFRFSVRALPVAAMALLACWLAISPAEPLPVPDGSELADLTMVDALSK